MSDSKLNTTDVVRESASNTTNVVQGDLYELLERIRNGLSPADLKIWDEQMLLFLKHYSFLQNRVHELEKKIELNFQNFQQNSLDV